LGGGTGMYFATPPVEKKNMKKTSVHGGHVRVARRQNNNTIGGISPLF